MIVERQHASVSGIMSTSEFAGLGMCTCISGVGARIASYFSKLGVRTCVSGVGARMASELSKLGVRTCISGVGETRLRSSADYVCAHASVV